MCPRKPDANPRLIPSSKKRCLASTSMGLDGRRSAWVRGWVCWCHSEENRTEPQPVGKGPPLLSHLASPLREVGLPFQALASGSLLPHMNKCQTYLYWVFSWTTYYL